MTAPSLDWRVMLGGDVRANPAYRLRPLSSLREHERASLARFGVDDRGAFGLLRSVARVDLPDKVVDPAAAELVEAFRQPRSVPSELIGRVAALVLDGVFEVDGPAGPVSGPRAFALVGARARIQLGDDRLSQLSRAGLDYAERLQLDDAEATTARLYCFHRLALSRRWLRSYPGPEAVLQFLLRSTLAQEWTLLDSTEPRHWLSFVRRLGTQHAQPFELPYKLYVSPLVEDLPTLLPLVVDALTESDAPRFKVGASAMGLLRPDKLVVYLRDRAETERAARALVAALDGTAAHGVPFTAQLAEDGWLSWGGDPPPEAAPVGRRAESWRLSVCRRLAEHLVAARRAGPLGFGPSDFALARLSLDGVDLGSFAPDHLEPPRLGVPDHVGVP